MKRREFLALLNPLSRGRQDRKEDRPMVAGEDPDADLFLRAMAKGIDPATVDAALLPELVSEAEVRMQTG